jgi:hypothetical protein
MGLTLSLPPMLSIGAAWISKALKNPNRFLLSFSAKTRDSGNIQIVLGNELSENFFYKIFIGTGENNVSKIMKKRFNGKGFVEEELEKVLAHNNPLARTTPGVFVPFWVSFDNGNFLVGQGYTPGKNIFLAFTDQAFNQNITRVGFCCDRESISLTDAKVSTPIFLKKTKKDFAKEASALTLTKNNPIFLSHPFKIPSTGLVSMRIKADNNVKVLLSQEQNLKHPKYIIEIKGQTGEAEISKESPLSGKMISLGKTAEHKKEKIKLKKERFSKLWINIENESIILGTDQEHSKNIVLHIFDKNPLQNIKFIGFSTTAEQATLDQIKLSQPMTTEKLKQNSNPNLHPADFASEKLENVEKFHIIFPFNYKLAQNQAEVFLLDQISKKRYSVARIPQKEAQYFITLAIKADGLPKVRWVWQPENANLIEKKKHAFMLSTFAAAFFQASSHIEGSGAIGQAIGARLSTEVTRAGIPIAEKAASLQADAQFSYKKAFDPKFFTDNKIQGQETKLFVPLQAQINKKNVDLLLKKYGNTQPSTKQKLDELLAAYKSINFMTNHQYVASDPGAKEKIKNGVASIFYAHQEFSANTKHVRPTDYAIMQFLIDTTENIYLLTPNPADQQTKSLWESWLSLQGKTIMQKSANNSIDLPALFSKTIWLEEKLPKPGEGLITFTLKTNGNFFIRFAEDSQEKSSDSLYEINLGADNGNKAYIRAAGKSQSVQESSNFNLRPNSLMEKQFWINLKNGKISVGTKEPSLDLATLSWIDPYPNNNQKLIGISTTETGAYVSHFAVKPALS